MHDCNTFIVLVPTTTTTRPTTSELLPTTTEIYTTTVKQLTPELNVTEEATVGQTESGVTVEQAEPTTEQKETKAATIEQTETGRVTVEQRGTITKQTEFKGISTIHPALTLEHTTRDASTTGNIVTEGATGVKFTFVKSTIVPAAITSGQPAAPTGKFDTLTFCCAHSVVSICSYIYCTFYIFSLTHFKDFLVGINLCKVVMFCLSV